ncbi:MAG: regulatory protein RecX [Longimicrobiales bacterium]|nr:regulatory protein RecX [Longimicrobiales bacterium]
MEITRTKVLASERVRIWVDGEEEPRAELALDLFMKAGLAAGDSLSATRLDELTREDEAYRARAAAMNLLAHRARSREELRRRLGRKEFPAPVIEETLEWLADRGYVDDRAFAESFVRDRLRLRPRGRLGLIQELRRKGVDGAVAETAIAEVMAAEDVSERDLALEAARAWARKNRSALRRAGRSKEEWRRARRRLYGHLARRGFVGDAVRAAIDAVLDGD